MEDRNERIFRIDPAHLEHDELVYEESIRPATGDTTGQGANTLLGTVTQRMNREREDGIDPSTVGSLNDAEEGVIHAEIQACRGALKRLFEQIDNQAIVAMTHVPAENAPKIKSRTMHYELRLKRIPVGRLPPENREKHEKMLKKCQRKQTMLDGILQPNEDGYPVLSRDISMSSVHLGQNDLLNSTAHSVAGSNGINPGTQTIPPPILPLIPPPQPQPQQTENLPQGPQHTNAPGQFSTPFVQRAGGQSIPAMSSEALRHFADNTGGAGPSTAPQDPKRNTGVSFLSQPSIFNYTGLYDPSWFDAMDPGEAISILTKQLAREKQRAVDQMTFVSQQRPDPMMGTPINTVPNNGRNVPPAQTVPNTQAWSHEMIDLTEPMQSVPASATGQHNAEGRGQPFNANSPRPPHSMRAGATDYGYRPYSYKPYDGTFAYGGPSNPRAPTTTTFPAPMPPQSGHTQPSSQSMPRNAEPTQQHPILHAPPNMGPSYTTQINNQTNGSQPYAPPPFISTANMGPDPPLQPNTSGPQNGFANVGFIPPRYIPPSGPNASFSSGYHPATTPFPFRNVTEPAQVNVLTHNSSQNRQPNAMNPCQAQQYLGKMLANRKYDGYQSDHKAFVGLEEFMGLIRQYKFSTGYNDTTILSQISTFMTGSAFTWWQTNGKDLVSLDEMEARLRGRFERQATDPTSILIEFAQRKQGREEDLLDYIDEMRQKQLRCGMQMSEFKAIEIIVDNTNETYNRILAARTYSSLNHLNSHAEYLVRGRPRKQAPIQRQDRRNVFPRARVAAVEETAEVAKSEQILETVSEPEDEPDNSEMEEIFADALERAKRASFRGQSKPNRWAAVEKKPPTESRIGRTEANVVSQRPNFCMNCLKWGHTDSSCDVPRKIRCFGCGKENVYRRNCDVCNPTPSKN